MVNKFEEAESVGGENSSDTSTPLASPTNTPILCLSRSGYSFLAREAPQSNAAQGFELLPLEMFHTLLKWLPTKELGILRRVSSEFCDAVDAYVRDRRARAFFYECKALSTQNDKQLQNAYSDVEFNKKRLKSTANGVHHDPKLGHFFCTIVLLGVCCIIGLGLNFQKYEHLREDEPSLSDILFLLFDVAFLISLNTFMLWLATSGLQNDMKNYFISEITLQTEKIRHLSEKERLEKMKSGFRGLIVVGDNLISIVPQQENSLSQGCRI